MTPLDLLWLFIILSSLQPMFQQRILTARRAHALRALEKRRGTREHSGTTGNNAGRAAARPDWLPRGWPESR